jgi:hypothetical protein
LKRAGMLGSSSFFSLLFRTFLHYGYENRFLQFGKE